MHTGCSASVGSRLAAFRGESTTMKFTILSHAGLLVEHAGTRLVCDPWLLGSCYWRSWWNFPEPDPELIAELRADYIYLTHLHWDHFHGPSLRRLFHPATRVLIPRCSPGAWSRICAISGSI